MPLLCAGPSVQRCHRHVEIVDMPDQSIRTTLFLLILWHCYPRPGAVTGFRTKRQGNRPQHLINVLLTDQMSLFNHQSCRPRFLNISIS